MIKIPPTHISQHSRGGGEFFRFIKNNRPELIVHFDELYVLKTKSTDGWRPLMNDSQYGVLMEEGSYVVAYALVRQVSPDLGILEWFETRIKGYGFATYLRRRLRSVYGDVLPRRITQESAGYWRKELGFDEEDVDPCEHMQLICGEDAKFFDWEALNC